MNIDQLLFELVHLQLFIPISHVNAEFIQIRHYIVDDVADKAFDCIMKILDLAFYLFAFQLKLLVFELSFVYRLLKPVVLIFSVN